MRMGRRRSRSREAAALPAVRQHRRDRVVHRNRQRARAERVRPIWPSEFVSLEQFRMLDGRYARRTRTGEDAPADHAWVPVGCVERFPADGGATIKYGAVANRRVQLREPRRVVRQSEHVSAQEGVRAVARHRRRRRRASRRSPVRCTRRRSRLATGESLQGEEYRIRTFPVKVEGDDVLTSSCRRRKCSTKCWRPRSVAGLASYLCDWRIVAALPATLPCSQRHRYKIDWHHIDLAP